jgi:predicted RecB family nuclease
MGTYSIKGLDGLDTDQAARLKAVGIRSTDALLARAGTPRLRRGLAEASGIPQAQILRWANIADLMRVPGVARDYAELLEAAGVETVKELKRRHPGRLTAHLAKVNADRNLVQLLPGETRVARWIEEAKSIQPAIAYRG